MLRVTASARIVQKQKDEILEALTTIRNIIDQNIEFDYSAHVGAALDRLAAAKLLTR